MATRARFGRLPRSAPSLTSTIVSLAQEYQRTRDRNIEDAWENGGLFEGKKVTDDQFLNHWRERLKSVSQDDPMWDYYNNLIYQYNFTIDESKMGQKYAEEKVSDAEMAQFYRKWAAKMPKDSQNYRQLMTQAAKFQHAASARARGNSARASAAAYARKQQNTFDEYEAPFDMATRIISRFAEQRGDLDAADLALPDHGWSKLTTATAENDPVEFADLLSDMMEDPTVVAAMTKVMKDIDKDFNGQFNEESLSRLAQKAGNGAGIRAHRAHKAGDTTGEKAAKGAANGYSQNNIIIRAVLGNNTEKGFVEENEKYRAAMDTILADPTKTPSEHRDAMDDYGKWLHDVGIPNFQKNFAPGTFDPFSANYNDVANGLLGRMNNTLNSLGGNPSGQTLKDDLFGFSTSEAGPESDAAKLGARAQLVYGTMADVDAGASKMIKVDSNGKIDPRGTEWAVYRNDDPDLQGHELVPFAVPADNGLAGEVRYTAAEPIRVAVYGGIDPNTKMGVNEVDVAKTSDPNIGSRIEIRGPGGQSYVIWGVMSNGEKVWTMDNPFSQDSKGSEGRDERGNWVIGYVDPEAAPRPGVATGPKVAGFNPSAYINQDQLKRKMLGPNGEYIDSTDGKPWDPTQDKEMAHYSPMGAIAHSSEQGMKWVSAMGPNAIAKAEREWYTDDPNRWSPDMKRALQQGARPEDVIEMGARNLTNEVSRLMREGFTPEQQQASRSSEARFQSEMGIAREASRLGISVDEVKRRETERQATNQRNEIAAQLQKWGTQDTQVNAIVARNQAAIGATGAATSRAEAWVKKGWTINELLNQPGMSVDQANDLAAIISGGAVGRRLEGGMMTRNLPGRGSQTFRAQPPQNPFAVIPPKPAAAPAPAPAPVMPVRAPDLPKSRPGSLAGGVTTAPLPEIGYGGHAPGRGPLR